MPHGPQEASGLTLVHESAAGALTGGFFVYAAVRRVGGPSALLKPHRNHPGKRKMIFARSPDFVHSIGRSSVFRRFPAWPQSSYTEPDGRTIYLLQSHQVLAETVP